MDCWTVSPQSESDSGVNTYIAGSYMYVQSNTWFIETVYWTYKPAPRGPWPHQ